ncbi:Desulfoferrodoxin Dfx [Acididesulfobacillus acetoxydans]|uniref:Desulfoferrodoxin n=1 Tax=Acididesulfobacillus acetoxydans TaxID=1561005 RepID=A0A8S0WEM5_9FIRM|nr:desulfoferrodoxin [Acididesulfobacillus acetoxydans]CAA7600272.1 Desulfoferrodoxin Dfx [Acididesulfobacillus acetoxydans]CEJ09650.1 Desulfoferrodoxin homolog [Acididesulfobacillus acetoxydans]
MTKVRELYKCNVCGNVIEVVNPGAPALVCCHQPMVKLDALAQEGAKEKHIPVVEQTDAGLLVKVGSVPHPMEEKHFIRFIEVFTANQVLRAELTPGQSPEAVFAVEAASVLEVRAYCNLHGLWKDR